MAALIRSINSRMAWSITLRASRTGMVLMFWRSSMRSAELLLTVSAWAFMSARSSSSPKAVTSPALGPSSSPTKLQKTPSFLNFFLCLLTSLAFKRFSKASALSTSS